MGTTLALYGRVVNKNGAGISGKTASLYDITTVGSPSLVTTTTTDANGYFSFTSQDDTKPYRVEIEYSASSSLKAVKEIFSGQAKTLQIIDRLHVRSAAASVFDGAVSIANGLTISAGGLSVTGTTALPTGTTIAGSTAWHAGNDGASSGLDADLLDGSQGSAYLLKSGGTMTGSLTAAGIVNQSTQTQLGQLDVAGNQAGSYTPLVVRNIHASHTETVMALSRTGSGVDTSDLCFRFLTQTGGGGWQWKMLATANTLTLDKIGDATPAIEISHSSKSAQFSGELIALENLAVGSAGDYAGGNDGIIFIKNRGTVPSTTPTGGGVLYVESGALKYKGTSGTVTTLGVA